MEFEVLVREHQATVFRTLLRLTGSREHLEDLAQEVFLRLYRGLMQFRGEAKVSTYLYRITYNVAQDEWKRRRSDGVLHSLEESVGGRSDEDSLTIEDRLASPERDAEQVLGARQLGDQIERELKLLSDVERSALVLYHQEECSYEQIAAILRLPIGTVKTHLHRGRQKLKERLSPAVTIPKSKSERIRIPGQERIEPCASSS